MGSALLPELGFIPKTPLPGQRRRSVSDAVLAVSLTECFFHHLHALPSILLWQQDCPCQACCGNRIAPPNPAVATGLLHPILLWQQDCPCQSCCGNRIAPPNPAVATGLLHPILRWAQDCPGALQAALASSSSGAGLRRARRRRCRAPPGPGAGRRGSTPAFQNRRSTATSPSSRSRCGASHALLPMCFSCIPAL